MRERHQALADGHNDDHDLPRNSPAKRLRLNQSEAASMIGRLNKHEITEDVIVKALKEAIQDETEESEQQRKAAQASKIPLYLVPLYNLEDARYDVRHGQGLFTFRPLFPIPKKLE